MMLDLPCLQSYSVHSISSRDGILSVSPVMFSAYHLQQRRYTLFMLSLCHLMQIQYTLFVSSHVQCMSPHADTIYSFCLQSCSVPPAETVCSLCLQSCSVHVTSSRDGILTLSPIMLSLCLLMQIQYTLFVSSLCLQSCSVPPAETVYSLCLQSCSVHVISSRDGILSLSPVMFGACYLQQRRYTLCVSSHVQCMSSPAAVVYSLCLQSCSSRDGILSLSPVMFGACTVQFWPCL